MKKIILSMAMLTMVGTTATAQENNDGLTPSRPLTSGELFQGMSRAIPTGRVVLPYGLDVTFDSEGGSPVNSQELTYGDAATKPADPVREGYTFAGWILYTNGNPSVYSFSAAVTGDITLHALWKKNDSSVSYTVIHQTDDGQILSTTTETAPLGSLVSKWALDGISGFGSCVSVGELLRVDW